MKGRPLAVCTILFSLTSVFSGGARAQALLEDLGYSSGSRLSLDDCVAIAGRENPTHQKAKLGITLSSSNVLAAYGSFLPSITGGYSLSEDKYYNPTYLSPEGNAQTLPVTYTTPGDTTATFYDANGDGDLTPDEVVPSIQPSETTVFPIAEGKRLYSAGQLQFSQLLFDGGRSIFALRSSQHAKRASEKSLDRDSQLLTFSTSSAYFGVLARQNLLELARRALEQRKEQLRLAQARYQVGSVTKLDAMQAEIDLGNQENAVLQAEQELEIARMELNRIMGIDLEESYEVNEDSVLFEPALETQTLVERALENRPDLVMLEAQRASNENLVRAERGSYLPTITFDLSFFRSQQGGANDSWTFSPDNRDTRFGFSMNWDFFSGFSRENRITEAKVSAQNSRYDLLDKKLSIEKEVKEAVLSLERIYRQSLITRKNRELARETLTLERERYRLGSASLLDLRTAQVTYIQAETDHISKVLEFKTTLAQLEYAAGVELTEGEIGGGS
jgi:outer membrane protein TolC